MAAALQPDSDEIISGINVTPLVDIILVLLIIFMLTANLLERQSIPVDLPEAATGSAAEPTTVALTLLATGELFLNGTPTHEAAVRDFLRDAVAADNQMQAIIAADKATSHGAVVHLIDLVRQQGVHRFALNIEPVGVVEAAATPL